MNVLTDTTLTHDLDELAAMKPTEYPFVSLYLNTQPDQHGRDNFEPFVRKEFKARARAFPQDSPALASCEHDTAQTSHPGDKIIFKRPVHGIKRISTVENRLVMCRVILLS